MKVVFIKCIFNSPLACISRRRSSTRTAAQTSESIRQRFLNYILYVKFAYLYFNILFYPKASPFYYCRPFRTSNTNRSTIAQSFALNWPTATSQTHSKYPRWCRPSFPSPDSRAVCIWQYLARICHAKPRFPIRFESLDTERPVPRLAEHSANAANDLHSTTMLLHTNTTSKYRVSELGRPSKSHWLPQKND